MTVISSKEKQNKILKEMHECPIGGHQGGQRTYERLKLYVTWPGMFQDVENYYKNCEICQNKNLLVLIPKHLFKKLIISTVGQNLLTYCRTVKYDRGWL
jgi:hypothetical protein